jgi:hypothetical protein
LRKMVLDLAAQLDRAFAEQHNGVLEGKQVTRLIAVLRCGRGGVNLIFR